MVKDYGPGTANFGSAWLVEASKINLGKLGEIIPFYWIMNTFGLVNINLSSIYLILELSLVYSLL